MAQKILISIPARNEAEKIARVISSSVSAVKSVTNTDPAVLVIDDGSKDETSNVSRSNGAVVIQHEHGKGLGAVFSEAVDYALENKFDVMLTIDGDGQFSADDIASVIGPVVAGKADFVTGSRFIAGAKVHGIPRVKHIGNHAMSHLISSILGKRFKDVSCGFRAYSREALLHTNMSGGYTYTQEVFLNLGVKNLRIKEVPITVEYFNGRKSRIAHSIIKYAFQTSKIIFRCVIQYRPMRMFGFLATVFFAIGLPIVAVLGVRYAITDTITPHKGIAIVGIVFLILSFMSLTGGIILDIISRLQLSIERTLYHARKRT